MVNNNIIFRTNKLVNSKKSQIFKLPFRLLIEPKWKRVTVRFNSSELFQKTVEKFKSEISDTELTPTELLELTQGYRIDYENQKIVLRKIFLEYFSCIYQSANGKWRIDVPSVKELLGLQA